MERLIALARTHPALTGLFVIILVGAGVGLLLATLMTRAGLSLKPLVFFYVFLGIIVGPQIVFHVLRARGIAPDLTWTPQRPNQTLTERESTLTAADGKFLDPVAVFGAGFDRDLVSDVRRIFPTAPEVAQMAIFPNAESVVVARFSDQATAGNSLRTYAMMMGAASLPPPAPDGSFTFARASDLVRLLAVGRTLFAWTGANEPALDRRQAASSGTWSAAARTAASPDPRVAQWWKIMAVATVALVMLATLWFFKGSAWATTIRPDHPEALPGSAGDLRSRLLAIEDLRQPVQITAGASPNEVIVNWRVDAEWLDHARAHGLRRTHRLVLQLDETARTVRVREYSAQVDWSAGAGGANYAWRAERGIVFFQVAHERVFGLQLDPVTHRVKPVLTYAYTFNLQEMKAPLISTVLAAGWAWKPVLFDAPPWLRWAVE